MLEIDKIKQFERTKIHVYVRNAIKDKIKHKGNRIDAKIQTATT